MAVDPLKQDSLFSRCKDLSIEVINVLLNDLRKRGAKKELIDTLLRENLPKIGKIIEAAQDPILEAALKEGTRKEMEREQVKYEKMRSDYFGRLLISRIEGFFPSYAETGLANRACNEFIEGVMPREIIPGLINAIRAMFGADFIEQKEKEADALVGAHAIKGSGRVDWEKVYQDPHIKKMVDEIYGGIRKKLSQDHGQIKNYFVNKITTSDRYRERVKRDFEDRDFQQLARAMYRGLD